MFRAFYKFLELLDSKERRQFYLLILFSVAAAALEVVGIASVVPFLALLANPNQYMDHVLIVAVRDYLHLDDLRHLLIVLGLGALGLLCLANCVIAWTSWRILNFTYHRAHFVSMRMMRSYLAEDFDYFARENTANLRKNILDEATQIIQQATVPMVQAWARIPVVVFILLTISIIEPLMSLVMFLLLGGAYAMIYLIVRHWLARAGDDRVKANTDRFQIAQQAFDGIIELKLYGLENRYLTQFGSASDRLARAQALGMIISQIPRYALEIIAFGMILLVPIFLLVTGGDLAEVTPLLLLFAMAAVRLLPALQLIFAGIAKARVSESALDLLLSELSNRTKKLRPRSSGERLHLRHAIEVRNLTYRYADEERPDLVLSDVSFRIASGTTVGFAGRTGSGKTTLVNLMAGLLFPESGAVIIDGREITKANVDQWRLSIGYVPQQIQLIDATIQENIAFGIDAGDIDQAKLQSAAEMAKVHDFIQTLPQKYLTQIGERGVRLSGGQKQRLGIARALYRQPDVLILDEATSALDTATEAALMEAIADLAGQKTILLIAHRLQTLAMANSFFWVSDGLVRQTSLEQINSYLAAEHETIRQAD
jgi:ATP-binding cassette, subfamily B, bacterial PglK